MKSNASIRNKAKSCGVHLWQIAVALEISDGNFSRKLRQELPQDEKEKILAIIDELAQKQTEVI